MKTTQRGLLALLLVAVCCPGLDAQNVPTEVVYPDTLHAPDDSLELYFPLGDARVRGSILDPDFDSWGTDGVPHRRVEIRTLHDTVSLTSVNGILRQHIRLPVLGKTDTLLYTFRFNGANQPFPKEYRDRHAGTATFVIPEAYELANVILYLSELSDSTGNHPAGNYAKAVETYFAPHKRHALIKLLDRYAAADYFDLYYSFRENAYGYRFDELDQLQAIPYHHIVWPSQHPLSGEDGLVFSNLLYLVQDFANQSNFRTFYRQHSDYYRELEATQQKLMPVEAMRRWLENEFPARIDHYGTVFSPLIGGSHSTQGFTHNPYDTLPGFTERIMFVNGPENILASGYDQREMEALHSGIVFTEIDHNYVNPISSQHKDVIQPIMGELVEWNSRAGSGYYDSAYATFNEYLTHALFCLYAQESYDTEVAGLVIEQREALMVRRDFPRFRAFNRALMERFARDKRTQPLHASYPEIISLLEAD